MLSLTSETCTKRTKNERFIKHFWQLNRKHKNVSNLYLLSWFIYIVITVIITIIVAAIIIIELLLLLMLLLLLLSLLLLLLISHCI